MKKVLLGLTAALIAAGIFTAATAVRENASTPASPQKFKPMKCAECNGKGKADGTCDECYGSGKKKYWDAKGKEKDGKCPTCKGKGTVKKTCWLCKGKGKV